MKKYIGTIHWASTRVELINGEIPRAIMNEDAFTFDLRTKESAGGINLKSPDKINYTGAFNFRDNDEPVEGKVTGRLYQNVGGCVMIGQWLEEGEHFTWIAELKPVDSFPDEKRK